jgi:hypothetical protein
MFGDGTFVLVGYLYGTVMYSHVQSATVGSVDLGATSNFLCLSATIRQNMARTELQRLAFFGPVGLFLMEPGKLDRKRLDDTDETWWDMMRHDRAIKAYPNLLYPTVLSLCLSDLYYELIWNMRNHELWQLWSWSEHGNQRELQLHGHLSTRVRQNEPFFHSLLVPQDMERYWEMEENEDME